ncbi:MAG: ribonuclease H [uncultured bacterium (gcode 4)]|uniref:Ribonuclease H n=1 Tax=uncultured bacterium (gcode 4) TaxID=1234023 RepID=K1YXZ4_9BACT|nr:MAG: ribonuclease H [uncultured bacterium (gcode 4)]HBB27474.1 ribonuclease H [Candidatus Gracilibacteria bacterium]
MKLKIYTDGGARNNPGPAGIGVFITDENGKPLERRHKYLGIATNNQAEYQGALHGIRRGIELGATEIELRMDSKLVVEQLSGNFKIKNPELKIIFREIQDLLEAWCGRIQHIHIRREHNGEADRLSNVAMDEGTR